MHQVASTLTQDAKGLNQEKNVTKEYMEKKKYKRTWNRNAIISFVDLTPKVNIATDKISIE